MPWQRRQRRRYRQQHRDARDARLAGGKLPGWPHDQAEDQADSCNIQLLRGHVDASPAWPRRCVDQSIHPGRPGVKREPQLPQRPLFRPGRTSALIPGCEVFGERSEEGIPAIIAGAARLLLKEPLPLFQSAPIGSPAGTPRPAAIVAVTN